MAFFHSQNKEDSAIKHGIETENNIYSNLYSYSQYSYSQTTFTKLIEVIYSVFGPGIRPTTGKHPVLVQK